MYRVRNVLSSTIVYLPFDLFLPPRLLPALKPPETKWQSLCSIDPPRNIWSRLIDFVKQRCTMCDWSVLWWSNSALFFWERTLLAGAHGFSCTLTVQIGGGLRQRNMKISIALERMDAPSMSMVTIFSQREWWSLRWNKYCANQALINASRVLIDAPGFPFPLGHL